MSTLSRPRRIGRLLAHTTLALATTFSMLAIAVATAPQASAAVVPPVAGLDAGHVTADVLPTVQVNGVVWDQLVLGNTVYVVGDFSQARPAGSAPGSNETPRANMLAYNLTTGALIPGFVANLNSQAKTVVASPDGSRIYIGGQFTTVNGASRLRIAALNPTTGAVISAFNAGTSYIVNDLAATATTVYAGGPFSQAQGQNRSRLAAFAASDGSLLPWAPSADATVETILVTPDGSKVIAGGHFLNINGSSAYGMGAIDPVSGDLLPWVVNQTIRNGGVDGAILDLSTDGTSVFANGYTFGRASGNLEGIVKIDPSTGALVWVEDCHGDTYGAFPVNGYVYSSGHHHQCGNLGGKGQSDNSITQWGEWMRHATSYKDGVAGTLRRDNWDYHNLEGLPAPSMTAWAPEWQVGSYTGVNQATWDVDGNTQYVTYGGEFTKVNNINQQGLVRFAVRGIAPKNDGPRLANDSFPLNVVSPAAGQARISFAANFDRDDQTLTYDLRRDGVTVQTTTAPSTYFDQPTVSFLETGLEPGQSYGYQVRASDPDGNTAFSTIVPVVARTTGAPTGYANRVVQDGARIYWRLGDAPGSSSARDSAQLDHGTVSAMTFGRPGAILGDPDTAATPTGTSSRIVQPPLINRAGLAERNPVNDEISVEAWFRTTSSQGGRILGFGNSSSGTSSSTQSDRVLYVSNTGRVLFGVRTRPEGTGATSSRVNRTISNNTALNDGSWHHVVGTLSPDGMNLYVDGALVSSRTDTNSGHGYYGYWRVGADTLSGWTSQPSSTRLSGDIDEAAVYYNALSGAQVSNHWVLSGRAGNQPPAAAFTWSADDLTASFDALGSTDNDGTIQTYAWNFGDGTNGTGINPSHTYATAGTRTVTLTVTDNNGATGVVDQFVTVTAPVPNVPPHAEFTATPTGLDLAVDSNASSDPDGSILFRSWDFGDGGTATGTTANHTYAADGTYTVTLTVTDNDGDIGTASQEVDVAAPVGDVELARDEFSRVGANGWGTADLGGAWTVTGNASTYSVNGSAGRIAIGVGQTRNTSLGTIGASADVDSVIDLSLEQGPAGSGVYLTSLARRVGTNEYRFRVRVLPTETTLQLSRVVGGTTTILTNVSLPGVVYTAGAPMHLRFRVIGSGTTSLSGKFWFGAAAEPAGWMIQASDTTGTVVAPGRVGLETYVSGTSPAITLLMDRIRAILAV